MESVVPTQSMRVRIERIDSNGVWVSTDPFGKTAMGAVLVCSGEWLEILRGAQPGELWEILWRREPGEEQHWIGHAGRRIPEGP